MMRRLILFIGLICAASAQAASIDTSAIADPKVKAAVDQINARQASIAETSCSLVEITKVYGKITRQENVRIDYRAPGLMRMTRTTVGGLLNGKGSWILLTENRMWKIDTRAPGHLAEDAKRMRNAGKSQAEIEREIEKRKATYTKIDLDRMKEAGLFDVFMEPFVTFLLPQNLPAASKWQLQSETPLQWVFVTRTRTSDIRLTFDKHSGICIHEQVNDGSQAQYTKTVSPFVVNPKPPIQNATFIYKPPPNTEFKDITDEMLDITNRRSQSPSSEP